MKTTEESLKELWNIIVKTNIDIIEVSEERMRGKGPENLLKEGMVENFPNLGKELNS